MAITYVGGVVGGRVGTTSTTTQSLSGTLTGGSDSSPKAGDLVIITCVVGSQARNPAQAISGWTSLGQLNPTAGTYDTSMDVSYKFMTRTPDTSITIPSTGNAADAQSWCVQVFRGVHHGTPLDVAVQSATGTGTSRANPPSITPSTAGAWVVCCAGGADSATANLSFADLTNVIARSDADTNDSTVAMGTKTNWTSGAFDCSVSTTGSNSGDESWAAYSLVLRPTPLLETFTENFDAALDSGKWTVNASAENSPAFTSGELDLPYNGSRTNGSYGYVINNSASFNFLGSSIYAKIRWPRATSDYDNVTADFFIEQVDLSGGWGDRIAMIGSTNGGFAFYYQNDYASTELFVERLSWNADDHTWWRMRESGGTVYFDTAPASADNPPSSGQWVNQYSAALSTFPSTFSNVAVNLGTSCFDAGGTITVQPGFDGLNTAADSAGGATHATSGALPGLSGTIAGSATRYRAHDTSGAATGPGAAIVGTAVYNAKHDTSGVLPGLTGSIVGSAVYNAWHTSNGGLTGPGPAVVGSAARTAIHATSGALAGPGAAVVGTAARVAIHTSSGALAGVSSLSGEAHRKTDHVNTGVLVGQNEVPIIGSARRDHFFVATGALPGQAGTVAGAAARKAERYSSGVLPGQAGVIVGAAARKRAMGSTGVVTGPGSVIAGTAAGHRTHDTAGALTGPPGGHVTGTAWRAVNHACSGILVRSGSIISGAASQTLDHPTSGALNGQGVALFGLAARSVPTGKLASITDTFDAASINASKWNASVPAGTGTNVQSGGQLSQTVTSTNGDDQCNVVSVDAKDLTNSRVFTKLVQPMTSTSGLEGAEAMFALEVSAGNFIAWRQQSDGSLHTHRFVGGAFAEGNSMPYTTAQEAWWSIRESGGTIYFETAPASANDPPLSNQWVQRHTMSVAGLGFAITLMRMKFVARVWQTGIQAAQAVKWDCVNTQTRNAVVHTSSGVLAGQGKIIVGVAGRKVQHATSGVLAGQGKVVTGVARRDKTHYVVGALLADGAAIIEGISSTSADTRKVWFEAQDTAGAWSEKPHSAEPWTPKADTEGGWGSQ